MPIDPPPNVEDGAPGPIGVKFVWGMSTGEPAAGAIVVGPDG
jgi:hypothetical protein